MKKLVAYIVLSALIFSTMEVVLKITGAKIDPFQLTFIRFAIGGLFLLPFAINDLKTREVHLDKRDYLYLLFLGIVCTCVSMIFFQVGVMQSNASTAAVIFCVNPMFTMIFAHFITEEKMNKQKVIALAVSLLGIVITINPFNISEGNTIIGMGLTLLSALTFGFYSAVGKRRIQKIGGIAQTSLSFIFGSLSLLVIMLFMGKPVVQGIGLSSVPLILFLGIVVTGVGYYFYFKAIEIGGASKGGIVFFLKPVFAPLIAVIVLKEVLTLNICLGIVFMLIGSFMNLKTSSNVILPVSNAENEG